MNACEGEIGGSAFMACGWLLPDKFYLYRDSVVIWDDELSTGVQLQ